MNLSGKVFNPGELRTLVTLQSVVLTKTPGGVQLRSYVDLDPATWWVKWTNAHGSEAIQAQALQVQALATVLMRYRADVTANTVILKDGQRWEIIGAPDNIQERCEYMELKVQLTKGGV